MKSESAAHSIKFTPLCVKSSVESFCSFIMKLWNDQEFNKTIPPLLNVLDLALNISIIIMGIIYRNDCPYHYVFEDSSSKPLFKINLPLILIVFGVFILIIYNLDFVFGSTSKVEKRDTWQNFLKFILKLFLPLLYILLAVIILIGMFSFVIGNNLVFQTTHITNNTNITLTFTNSSSNGYCNETFFLFALFTFASFNLIFGATFFLIIIMLLYFIVSYCFIEFERNIKGPSSSAIVKASEHELKIKKLTATELII